MANVYLGPQPSVIIIHHHTKVFGIKYKSVNIKEYHITEIKKLYN